MKAKNIICGFAAVLAAAASGYSVDLPVKPQSWEKTAGEELQKFLTKRIEKGFSLDGHEDVVLHVGDTAFAAEKGLASSKIEEERWVIRSFGRDLVLNGGGSRGALYAVYHFLEDACGVRFWSETEIDVPDGRLELAALDLTGRPVFGYRDIHRTGNRHCSGVHAARRRLNRNGDGGIGLGHGGTFDYGLPYHCHTFALYFPEKEYFKDHPEYYSLVKGKRVAGPKGQLCFSNPEVRRIMREKLWNYIRRSDDIYRRHGALPPRMYEISINDGGKDCECPNCRAEVAKYGWSGAHLRLVNELAEDVAKTRPELFITMLLYAHTEEPPKGGMAPRDNVIVKLCDTKSNQIAPISDPCNRVFQDFLGAWGKIAKHVFIWDYAPVFQNPPALSPFPSEFVIQDDYRYFCDNHVWGVFLEHEYQDIGDFFDVKSYIETKAMEDPYQDREALLRDAFGYFGPAGKTVRAARQYLYDRARERGIYVNFAPWKVSDYLDGFRLADAEHADRLWAEAERLVKDDERYLRRVRFCRRSNDTLLRCLKQQVTKRKDGTLVFSGAAFAPAPGLPYSIVEDAASPDGRALKFDVDRSVTYEFEPPFEWGFWDAPKGRSTSSGTVPKPTSDSYAWYDLGEVTLPGDYGRWTGKYNAFFYLESRFGPHIRIIDFESQGWTFKARALMRATGARYHFVDTRENALYVAQLEFIPVRDTKVAAESHGVAGEGAK